MQIVQWAGCYDEGWRDLIVPAAFAHPAKMSRALVARIYDALFASGALSRGAIVVDPFGGIGTTAIEGASRGVQVVCCELEPKFVGLAEENFALHARDWEAMGRPTPRIVNGDSRRLREHVGPVLAECVVSSPPYSPDGLSHGGGRTFLVGDTRGTAQAMLDGYGTAPGQLGNMREGDVDAVISSPPYAGNDKADNTLHDRDPRAERFTGAFRGSYGTSDGQLGAMKSGEVDAVISSPPYAEIASGSGGLNTKPAKDGQQGGRSASSPSQDTDSRYGESAGQLARMSLGDVDAIVSSPPYEDSVNSDGHGIDWTKADPKHKGGRRRGPDAKHDQTLRDHLAYGDTPGQLGAMKGGAGVDAIVSSPPFTQGYAGGGGINVKGYGADGKDKVGSRTYQGTAAEREPGNLETMPLGAVADALVSSPPYEGSLSASEDGIDWQKAKRANNDHCGQQRPGSSVAAAYPASDENIGNATGETFWSAALDIVRESYAILKPGGTAVWVVKAFVRDKQLVDFPGDWRKLCESVGFETVTEVHAMLVAEETRTDLFDGPVTKRRERKSFFRRLAEKKGSPRIDWETVYFMRKP